MSHDALVDTNTVAADSATGTLTAGAAVPVGRTIIVATLWESGAGTIPAVSSVTDDRGNTYAVDVTAGAAGNTTVALMLARGRVTTQLEAGDDITVTIGETRSRWCLQADSFDDVNASSPLDKSKANNNPGSSASMSSGVTTATAQAYELLVAAFGLGVGRTITIPAGWTGTAVVETSTTNPNRALQVIYKYTSATGTQEGTISVNSASTYAGLIATYKATAPTPAGSAGPPLRRPQLHNLLVR